MAENALAYPGDVNALAGGAAGAQSSNALARPSPLSWEGMRDNLSNLYHSLAEGGLYFTPAAIPLSARDAYNAATTQPEESKLSPLNVQGNRTPDLSTLQGWRSGLSDLYQSGGDTGLALTGMFAGPRAKTADLSKMNRAAAMESAGHSPDTIWKETGWFKGADGKWKFEIPDDKMKPVVPLNEWISRREDGTLMAPNLETAYDKAASQLTPQAPVRLKRIWDHPELDLAYPHGESFSASQDHPSMMGLPVQLIEGETGPAAAWMPEQKAVALHETLPPGTAKSAALHELQHVVQGHEGFANGGNIGDFTYGNSPLYGQRKSYESAQDAYKRLAGETEARNVQARMNMTPEERMLTPPWKTQDVPNEQQIVRFGNDGVQNSIDGWHGSQHDFPRFDINKVGTGEGTQPEIHGLFFGGRRGTGESYQLQNSGIRVNGKPTGPGEGLHNQYAGWLLKSNDADINKAISDAESLVSSSNRRIKDYLNNVWPWQRPDQNSIRQEQFMLDRHMGALDKLKEWKASGAKIERSPGHLYDVSLDVEPSDLLHLDEPFKNQPEKVRNIILNDSRLKEALGDTGENAFDDFHDNLARRLGGSEQTYSGASRPTAIGLRRAADALKAAGIPGVQYNENGPKGARTGYNYVMFDDGKVKIVAKDGKPVSDVGFGNEGVQESRNALGGQSIDPTRRAEIQKWLKDQGIK